MKTLITVLSAVLLLASCAITAIEDGEPVNVTLNLNAAGSKAPTANLNWTGLTITGSEMDTISMNGTQITAAMLAGGGSVTVPVMPGTGRTFSLSCNTGSVYYSGSETVDIAEDSTPTVAVPMSFSHSNLLIPDIENDRLVQINNMSGTGWVEQGGSDPVDTVFKANTVPIQADYDNFGNVYVLTYTPAGYRIVKTAVFTGDTTDWGSGPGVLLDETFHAGPFTSVNDIGMFVEKDTGYVYIYEVTFDYDYLIIPILPDGSTGTILNIADTVLDAGDSDFSVHGGHPLGKGTIVLAYSYYDYVDLYNYLEISILEYSGGSSGTWTQMITSTPELATFQAIQFNDHSFIKVDGNNIYLIANGWFSSDVEFRSLHYTFTETTITHIPLPDESLYYSYIPTSLGIDEQYSFLSMFDNGTPSLYLYATVYDNYNYSVTRDLIIQFPDATFGAGVMAEYGSTGTGVDQFQFDTSVGAP